MSKTSRIIKRQPNRWAEGAIVYQIYPRSYFDANNDGIGDIAGVTLKLKHLKKLGVNVIWLSPFYPSPMADFGYDVADYCDVDPIFGSLKDMDVLIKQAHRKDIKVLVDLVPNHSSDEHAWFRQSRQSKENEYSDWYIWRDAKEIDKNGNPVPPNNWLDIFSGESAWEWEPARQQFYLHSFDVRQPDLNWTNPHVREAIKQVMRFWLDRGADGFRVDAVRFMGKDPLFKDNPKNPHYKPGHGSAYGSLIHSNSQGWPQLHAYLSEMAEVLKEPKYRSSPRFMVTESYPETHEPVEEYLAFYGGMDPEVAAPFNFEGLGLPWRAAPWRKFLSTFHPALGALSPLCVASYAFGNHDQSRLVSRLGEPAARAAAVMLLTLPGMAFIYNGEEIGMQDGEIPRELVQDPSAKGGSGRDPERTPLQWTSERNAGFSKAERTWLPVSRDYTSRNIRSQSRKKDSFLRLYQQLGRFRNKSAALRHGSFSTLDSGDDDVLVYARERGKDAYLTVVNFSDKDASIQVPAGYVVRKRVVSSIPHATRYKKGGAIKLLPHEAMLLAVRARA